MAKLNSFTFTYPYLRIEPKVIFKNFDLDNPHCYFIDKELGYRNGHLHISCTREDKTLVIKFDIDKELLKSFCKEMKYISIVIDRPTGKRWSIDKFTEYKIKTKDLVF